MSGYDPQIAEDYRDPALNESIDREPAVSETAEEKTGYPPQIEEVSRNPARNEQTEGEQKGRKPAEEKTGSRIETIDKAIAFAHVLHRYRQQQNEIIAGADKSIQALQAEIAVIEEWR